MSKKLRLILQKAVLIFTAFVFGVLIVGSMIAWENSQMVSSAINAQTFEIIEDPDAENIDSEYFKSAYTKVGDLIKAGAETTEEVMKEGAVLMKNENNGLPLAKNSKITVFGVGGADPVYGGTGSGTVDTSKAIPLYEGLEDAGFQLHPILKSNYLDTNVWFKAPARGGTYDVDTHYRRYNSFSWDGTGKKWIGEVPWEEVETAGSSLFSEYNKAAVYVIARVGGEGQDSSTNDCPDGVNNDYLRLSEKEIETITEIGKLRKNGTFEKFIILFNGAILPQLDFMNKDDYAIDSAMWVGGYGQNGAAAVGKLISGDYVPSGRTADTLWYDNWQNPTMVNFGVFNYTNDPKDFSDWQVPTSQGGNDVTRPSHTSYIVYQEGMYLGYKYTETRYEDYVRGVGNPGEFDYNKVVAYPFGYGLSYTTFTYSDFTVTKQNDRTYELKVKVTNSGSSYSGKESVQVYISKPYEKYATDNKIQVPSVELIDFGKTDILGPGKSDVLTISIDEKFFTSYDAHGAGTYVLMPGKYYLTVASDAHHAVNNILAAKGFASNSKITGKKGDVNLTKEINLSFTDQKYRYSDATDKEITNLFDFVDINTYEGKGDNKVDYYNRSNWNGTVSLKTTDYVKLKMTKKMADEMLKETPFGSSNFNLPERQLPTDEVWYKENPNDRQWPREYPTYGTNPDGTLRTDKDATQVQLITMRVDSEGNKISYNDSAWDTFMNQLTYDEIASVLKVGARKTGGIPMAGKPQTADNNGPNGYNQVYRNNKLGLAYRSEVKKGNVDDKGTLTDAADPDSKLKTTAMPTNGILAGAFNKELAYKAGSIIGEDGIWAGQAGIYGIGANIHRTPYSGRNAEYYSECGMLTGIVAAYECKAIEEKGVHVYNKHAALNDQENTRHGIATWTTEQATREIYLRAFELPILIGDAHNIMAAFNRLGIQTAPACKALGEDFFRGECGMQGIIVTDAYGDYTGYYGISSYYQHPYGVYYGGCDIPDGDNIQTDDKRQLYDHYKPDADNNGEYSRMAWQMRQAVKRVMYACVHSNAMNGFTAGTRIVQLTPWWQTLLISLDIVFGVLMIASVAWIVITLFLDKRKS